MNGLMQERPLLVSGLIAHAEWGHAATPVLSREADGHIHATNWGMVAARARRLAAVLQRLGVRAGDRVATLAWNTHRHLELYYAITGIGAVCHTINPRLFTEQVRFIGRHAADLVLFFEPQFAELAAMLSESVPELGTLVVLSASGGYQPEFPDGTLFYEDLISDQTEGLADWPAFDERQAAALCYTSGTTGDPKGVLYSHRSCILHAYAAVAPDCFNISALSVLMPACSMYHANAWGVPHAAAMTGACLVLPGAQMGPGSLSELIKTYSVTHGFGVPTIWLGLIQHLQEQRQRMPSLQRLYIGGSAVPPAMAADYAAIGVDVRQLWGMTETSPLGVVASPKWGQADLTGQALEKFRRQQGRPLFGVELRLTGEDGNTMSRNALAAGNLEARGWWVAERYFGQDQSALVNGWFPTGDVATLDADGSMRITDRVKDVIKSGGEWISSIDLENAAIGHPAVAEAAVVGVQHPKWDERPLLILRLREGAVLPKAEMLAFLGERVVRWWIPDDVIVVQEIPHSATGKIQKTVLRAQYAEHLSVKPDEQYPA